MPDLLDAYLAEERLKPFVWGEGNGDCILFVAGWVDRLRGTAFGDMARGRYSNEAEARVVIDRHGGAVELFRELLGPAGASPWRRGDVALRPFNDWWLGMICTGDMWAARAGKRGIVLWRRAPAFVWSMGFNA